MLFSSCSNDDENNPEQSSNDAVSSILEIINITENSATIKAEVVSSPETVTERGVVWGTTSNPTLENNKIASGNGLGVFEVTLQNLEVETTYFVRNYARSSSGVGYSASSSFETIQASDAQVFEGDIFLTTQEDVNAFASNSYCVITGDLSIGSFQISNSIVDLTPLKSIKEVGRLIIGNNSALLSLEGLNNLITVNRGILLDKNENLQSIDALASISGNVGNLIIVNSPSLVSLDPLQGIQSLSGSADVNGASLFIAGNANLLNLNGLQNIQSIDFGIAISVNESLQNIDALSNISGVLNGSLTIFNNASLETLSGLQNINQITGNAQFSKLASISSLNSIFNLSNIGETLVIAEIPNLLNLQGLENIISVGSNIFIESNQNLSDFCNLNNLIFNGTLGGEFIVENNLYNPTLEDMQNGNCSQ